MPVPRACHRLWRLAIALAPVLASAPAAAQTAPADELVVEGARLPRAVVEQRAQQFVRSVLPPPSYGQYGRWTGPICVKLADLADNFTGPVQARLQAAAAVAGVRMRFGNCDPNLLILFSEAGGITADVILRRKANATAAISGPDRALLVKAPLPVRWWHVLQPGNSSGIGGSGSAALNTAQFGENSGAAGVPGNSNTITTESYSGSLIDTHLALAITSAVVIVDVPLAQGKSLDALADYVAMVALAPIRLQAPPPAVPSVLASFSQPGTGTLLTDWDKAWLKGLYAMPLNRAANQQRGSITAAMTKALAGPTP
jgi:hypothetical protein